MHLTRYLGELDDGAVVHDLHDRNLLLNLFIYIWWEEGGVGEDEGLKMCVCVRGGEGMMVEAQRAEKRLLP